MHNTDAELPANCHFCVHNTHMRITTCQPALQHGYRFYDDDLPILTVCMLWTLIASASESGRGLGERARAMLAPSRFAQDRKDAQPVAGCSRSCSALPAVGGELGEKGL